MRKMLIGFVLLVAMQGLCQSTKQQNNSTVSKRSVQFQPLNVRAGLWENSLTTTIGGDSMVPAGLLSRMSPERRAKMEAAMRERAARGGHTTKYQSCVTAEELKEAPFADKQNCTSTLLSSTSSELKMNLACTMEDVQGQGTLDIQATSSTSVQGTGSGSATSNGQTMTTSYIFQGHWVKTDCGDVK